MPKDRFVLFRFLIVCCAADAQPVGVIVIAEESKNYATDSWVRVYGKCIVEEDKVSIVSMKIVPVQKPRDTYLYLNGR